MDLERKIIICNNLLNGRRYVQRLNLNNEVLLNYEILTLRMLIERNISYRLIDDTEASYIIFELIKANNYNSKNINTVGAVSKLLTVINDYRGNKVNDFSALYDMDYKSLLNDYYEYLDDNKLCDYIRGLELLDSVRINSKVVLLNDLELTKLESEVIDNVFNKKEEVNVIKHNNKYCGFYNCYGIYNEVLNVLDIIEKKRIPINDTEILYTNDIFENIIRGELDNRGIKYTLSSAHAKSTNLISFMLDVLDYIDNDFRFDLLEVVLKNKGLDHVLLDEFYSLFNFPDVIVGYTKERTIKLLNSIKGDNNKENIYCFINDLIDIYDDHIDYNKLVSFTFKYIKSKNEILSLANKINKINNILQYDNSIDVIKNELSKIRYTESDSDNALSISKINKLITIRGNIFIIGLSQNYVNVGSTENPFIRDIDKYVDTLGNQPTLHILKNIKNNVVKAIDYCLDNYSGNVYLSYSSYNKIDFRPSAPSIYFLNKLKENKGNLEEINKYDIYKKNIEFKRFVVGDSSEVIDDYDNGNITPDIESNNNHIDGIDNDILKEEKKVVTRRYTLSPSALKGLNACCYQYYYQYLLKISDVAYPKLNEYEWLEANHKGTLFHRIMELYVKREIIENKNYVLNNESFDTVFNIALNEIIDLNVIKNEDVYKIECDEMKKSALDCINKLLHELNSKNNKYSVIDCEYDLKKLNVKYDEIILSGIVDRIDGYLDNKTLHLRLVDYKTGGYKDKKKNDYIQHLFYPYVLMQAKDKLFGFDYDKLVVDSFLYLYPFSGDENLYEGEELDVNNLFERVDTFVIPYIKNEKYMDIITKYDEYIDKETCGYCNYKDICFKVIKDGEPK